MHAKRFKMLIDAVRKQPAKMFDMTFWKDHRKDCGTVGCAVGSFCIQHPGAALKLKRNEFNEFTPQLKTKDATMRSFEAAAKYFGITVNYAYDLFLASSYGDDQTKRNVLARLKTFYREHKNDRADTTGTVAA